MKSLALSETAGDDGIKSYWCMIFEIKAASDEALYGVLPRNYINLVPYNISKNTTPIAQTSPFSLCPYYLKAYGDI